MSKEKDIFSPKQYVFGNLEIIREIAETIEDVNIKNDIIKYIERIKSWESLIK